MGYGWVSNVGKHLEISGSTLTAYQSDGKGLPFTQTNGVWQGDPDSKLTLTQDATGYTVQRQDGSSERYDLSGHLQSETDRAGQTTTFTYDASNHIASVTGPFGHTLSFTYDGSGRLASLTDPAGQVTRYGYDAAGNLTQVSYPDGTAKQYSYGDSSFPHALTGVAFVDTNGVVSSFDNFVYDSAGKVATNTLAGGQQRFDLSYDSDTQTTVTDAAGRKDVLTFESQLGIKNLLSRVTQSDGKGLTQQFDVRNNLISSTDENGHTITYTYDDQNRLTSETQAAGTPQARTVSYQYGSDGLALPVEIDRPSVCSTATQRTVITYDAQHNPIQITENGDTPSCSAISRTLNLGYNSAGQVTKIDGPRTDVNDITTLSYNDCQSGSGCGQLKSVTDALGHTTTFDAFDANGRLLQKTDPNGLVTQYAYDPRGRVSRITQQISGGAARVTTFSYTPFNELSSVALPDGRTLTYGYDDAHELTAITDNLGDKVSYAYDSRGNRSQTSTYDPDGTLIRKIDEVYDLRNHLASINDSGSITKQVVDAVGNLLQQTDPNNNPPTTHNYDPLNRLIQTVNAIGGSTSYSYDTNGQVSQVITPIGATTGYQYDDFGDLLQEVSPDRGTTTYAYDAAGNMIQKTDARGVIASYSYDALNRLTAIHYSGATTSSGQREDWDGDHDRDHDQTRFFNNLWHRLKANSPVANDADISLTYDQGQNCSYGNGRLCSVQDQSGTTQYAYDAYGNTVTATHIGVANDHHKPVTTQVRYQYDAGDRIVGIIYPDGRKASIQRDAIGRVQAISTTVSGHSQPIVSDRQYRADGQLLSQTFGNGLIDQRSYTGQGQLSSWTLTGNAAHSRGYTYDANGNLTGWQSGQSQAIYQYDALDRLVDEQQGKYHNAYSYDDNGNRLTQLRPNGTTKAYSYAPQSNRMTQDGHQAVTLDAAGNTLDDGKYQYRYDAAGRLTEVKQGGITIARYRYDYRGLRRQKVTEAGTTDFTYDPSGHLISQRTVRGRDEGQRDYLWTDTAPIARIDSPVGEVKIHKDWLPPTLMGFLHHHEGRENDRAARLYYLHTDAMGTPRLATDAKQHVVWRWNEDVFGTKASTDQERHGHRDHDWDHSRGHGIQVNLRYPGQYYDSETGLFYNWNRYYDPNTGRYQSSDLIGLAGGNNTYLYANGNPGGWIDRLALAGTEEEFSSPFVPIEQDPLMYEYYGPALRNTLNDPKYSRIERHHSYPIFAGGDQNQPLTDLSRSDHVLLHRLLNDFLRTQEDEFGNHMRPQSNNSGADIRQNFTRDQLLRALSKFYDMYYDLFPSAAEDFFRQHPDYASCPK
ncbi:hypothetical protein A9404_08435 [Halothiobacillus diazotrophicus]|uniref:Teneurin-like YD-shell domain-containing protein n=1 Tax=Halothiobacillus diazotrophicus TaxID=1860122 RepID=A0A191ZHS9_9GAMM|nr:hypothetical protein A9404_08435 [Halothiobacillus diazotrophicus]